MGGPFVETELDSLAHLASSKGVSLKVLTAAREVNYNICEKILGQDHDCHAVGLRKAAGNLGPLIQPQTNSVAGSSSILLASGCCRTGREYRLTIPLPCLKPSWS